MKENGGYRRSGTLVQILVAASLVGLMHQAKEDGQVDAAIGASMFFGVHLTMIWWSAAALEHRKYAHRDQPDLNWKELRQLTVEQWGEMLPMGVFGLIIIGVFWLFGKLLF
jgi:hypothetical protein